MPSAASAGAAAVLAAVVLVALLTRPVLRRLPEPEAELVGGEHKTPYADLAGAGFVATCTVLAGAAVGTAMLVLPRAVLPMWWVLAVPVLVLVAVDARTTWMSWVLVRVGWVAMLAATAVTYALSRDLALLGRAGLGALAAGALYLLVHRLSRGQLGYGDVQLAPLLGAATAAVGWSMWFSALLLGSLAGAAYAVGRLALGRRGAFAYAPWMLAGAYLACALRRLTG